MTYAAEIPDTERALLGSVLLREELFGTVELDPEDFSLEAHRRLWRLFGAMRTAGGVIDSVTVLEELQRTGQLEHVSGPYLASLTEGLPRRLSVDEYADRIREKAMLRALHLTAFSVAERALEPGADADALIAEADRELLGIAARNLRTEASLEEQSRNALADLEAEARGEKSPCIPSGIALLDSFLGGYGLGELTVLGGRPGMGKSSAVAQTVIANCLRGNACHVFSLEMRAAQLLRRIWAAVADVPFERLRHAQRMSDGEMLDVRRAARLVEQWPLVIDDSADVTAEQVVARARIGKRRRDTKLVAVDYLQKLRYTRSLEHRHLDVTNATVAMARMAKEEGFAVLLLSSLTERSGRDRNAPPTLSDLRQSGDIAFEAHNALLLHRETDGDSHAVSPDTALIVAKARADQTGVLPLRFNTSTLLFEDRNGNGYV